MSGRSGAPAPPSGLPRRDLVLLPLLSLVTVLALLGLAEIGGRLGWAERGGETCYIPDPLLLHRARPNCTSTMKIPEGPETVNRSNECGYRTPQSCGPKPPGAVRVAVLGASFAEGYMIPYAQTFAAVAAARLARACGRPVEFQNLAIAGTGPLQEYYRIDEALGLDPDLILMALEPFELEAAPSAQKLAERDHPPPVAAAPAAAAPDPPLLRLQKAIKNSRAVLVAQHFLFQDRQAYLRLYLLYGDKADYLRPPFSPAWETRFAAFETLLGGMAERFRAAGRPFALVLGPQQAQAALFREQPPRPGVDPWAFNRRIAEIAARHGVTLIDVAPDIAADPAPERLYYRVDGHLAAAGHEIMGAAVARRLARGDIAAFAGCAAAAPAPAREAGERRNS